MKNILLSKVAEAPCDGFSLSIWRSKLRTKSVVELETCGHVFWRVSKLKTFDRETQGVPSA